MSGDIRQLHGNLGRAMKFPRGAALVFEQVVTDSGQKLNTMNTRLLIPALVVSAALTFGVTVQAKEKKHEEENISSSDVPSAVQQAAEKEAGGAKIVRWEKEGKHYEAVIEKDGKEWGYVFDANGTMKGKHDESKEKGEKHEH